MKRCFRLSFDVSPDGSIVSVYYPPDENVDVLSLKKTLLGTLSSKLVFTNESRWGYRVNETGHQGMKLICILEMLNPSTRGLLHG